MKKLPPIEKVYEAWSAVADSRVAMDSGSSTEAAGRAQVTSSDGRKVYTVTWSNGAREFTSNDNGSYRCGYAGYPVIAVMMELGKLPLDRGVARLYGGVDWHAVNENHRGDYAAALLEVQQRSGIAASASDRAARAVMDELAAMDVSMHRSSLRPPEVSRA